MVEKLVPEPVLEMIMSAMKVDEEVAAVAASAKKKGGK